MAGLYLHIPFCKQACYYCDFHFSTDTRSRPAMTDAMVREMIMQKKYLSETVETIYLGGGTPSLLTLKELDILFSTVGKNFTLGPSVEITLEANPDDLTKEKILGLRDAGINRLSIGVQSFNNNLLKFLHRAHDGSRARHCLEDVREAGFTNISIDLIHAIPGLTDDEWQNTLREALRFSPEHISSYALTLEEKTVFGNWSRHGKYNMVPEENTARQFEEMMDVLIGAGYEHYEISNFCKPGFYSRHNSSYWRQSPYLGIGPSAHSYNGESRQFNIRNNANYIRAILEGTIPFEKEILTRENKINEYILTSLRTQWGCDLQYLKKELDDDLMARSRPCLTQIQEHGLAVLSAEKLRLTRSGKLLADKIVEDLMIPT
jgi:oxygen-independent coproporphyrinogen-3 oxidase